MRAQTAPDAGWPNYGYDPGGTRYSPAKQIDRGNVAQLQVAWTYRTGALPYDEELDKKGLSKPPPYWLTGSFFLQYAVRSMRDCFERGERRKNFGSSIRSWNILTAFRK